MTVWIIPAVGTKAQENYPKTLTAPVEQQRLEMLPDTIELPPGEIYAWGFPANEGNRRSLEHMRRGDVCFFYTEDKTGKRYGWAAGVLEPISLDAAESISQAFWDSAGFLPYLLERPIAIDASAQELGASLDPSGTYLRKSQRGSMPIADEKRAASAIKLHGSLENWALDFIRRHRVSVLPSSEDIKHVLNGGVGSAKGPIEHSDNLFDLSVKSGSAGVSARAKRGGGQARRSKQAKWIGDLGELAVVEHLKAELPKALHGSIRWVAKLGETPGWDVEYLGMDGKLVMVEVKSTTCEGFASFDITENELRAAREHGKQYHLYLVARCNVGKGRRLQVIEDPATVLDKLIRPSVYRVGGG